MMQFYQKRDFGTFISDTFAFFKAYGKNYFKNYLLINGFLVLLMLIIFVLGYRELLGQIMGSNLSGKSYYFETYFRENQLMLIIVTGVLMILFMATGMIAYSYPILYMKRLSETGNKDITADEIIGDLKNNLGRFLKFFLGLIFIIMPLTMIVFGISTLLMIILIGFLILILLGPSVINVVNFLMLDYFHTKNGFFTSLSYAIRAQFSYANGREKSPFWKYWGSTVVLYLIIQVITGALTMVPVIFMGASAIAIPSEGAQDRFDGIAGVMIMVVYGISMLISFLMINVIFVNSGLQYYDSRTDLHRKVDFMEIDKIGVHEE